MALGFPNPMRSLDSTVDCVRFAGHDSSIEVSFFLTLDALEKVHPELGPAEDVILAAFDAHIEQIHNAASKAYRQNKGKYVFTLSADAF